MQPNHDAPPVLATHEALMLFLLAFVRTEGFPPSYKEMQAALGLTSQSLVYPRLQRLEANGLIRLPLRDTPGRSGARAIDVRPALYQDWQPTVLPRSEWDQYDRV